MGMVVRTNMAALNANNALGQASKAQQNGMAKLASGFKINKAADDASGLAISEKMKNQIKALDTAKDNCEDGANLIQTAEGYMNETHDILNRMTELAEKSANGTLADEDRKALQDEMNELCGEIDRIASTANFNGHKILDGSLGTTGSVKVFSDSATKSVKYMAQDINTFKGTQLDTSGLKARGTYTADAAVNSSLYGSSKSNDVTVKLKGPGLATAGEDKSISLRDGEMISIKKDDQDGIKSASGFTVKLNNKATEDNLYTYSKADDKWYDKTGTDVSAEINKIDVDIKKDDVFHMNEGINLQIGDSSTQADRLSVRINSFHTDTMFDGISGFKNTTINSTDSGATSSVKILKGNSSSTYKEARTIDISDKDNASAAADAIRQVSNYVSDQRGKLGAQQNRLEHTVNNLTTASENTTAANSRIRDTDMAKEMMAYTSKNVIAQAAQSMLAQANSQPQNVLSLLQ